MAMAETIDLSLFVEPSDAGASHMTLAVEGVSCAGCIRKIENGLNKLPGVIDARLNFTQRRLAVDWRNDETDAAKIIAAIETIGYHAHPFAPERADADESAQAKWLMKCLAVAGFAAMNVMLLSVSVWAGNVSDMTQETRDLFHWLSALIALPAAAYAGQPFFQSAVRALRARHVNMDVPISIGVTLALGLSVYETATHATHAYFDSAIMLLFFLLVGRYLDLAMRRKTRLFAGNLASIKAEFAHRLDASGELVQVPAAGQAHADALFLGDQLRPVLQAVAISQRARRLMKENLTLAVIYNLFAVPLAIAGLVTPLIAAVAMSGSSLLVTLNALRARLRPGVAS